MTDHRPVSVDRPQEGLGHSAPLRTLAAAVPGAGIRQGGGGGGKLSPLPSSSPTSASSSLSPAPPAAQQQRPQQQQRQLTQQRHPPYPPSLQKPQPQPPSVGYPYAAAPPPPPPPPPPQQQKPPSSSFPVAQQTSPHGGRVQKPAAMTTSVPGPSYTTQPTTAQLPQPPPPPARPHIVAIPPSPLLPSGQQQQQQQQQQHHPPQHPTWSAQEQRPHVVALPPPPAPQQPQLQQPQQQSRTLSVRPPPAPQQQPPQPRAVSATPPAVRASTSSASAQPHTLDADVDAFLLVGSAGRIHRAEERLRPPPLVSGVEGDHGTLERAWILARRRAWNDILTITAGAFRRDETGMMRMSRGGKGGGGRYAQYYDELVASSGSLLSSSSAGSSPTNEQGGEGAVVDKTLGEEPQRQDKEEQGDSKSKREAVELLALRLTAYLRLRRYPDLRAEVDRLGLLPDEANDIIFTAAATSGGRREDNVRKGESPAPRSQRRPPPPLWVPYGLRLLAARTLQYTHTDDNDPRCGVDVLHLMRERIAIDHDVDVRRWTGRVDGALADAFVRRKEWRLALAALEDLMEYLPHGVRLEVERSLESYGVPLSHNNNDGGGSDENYGEASLLTAALLGASRVEVLSRQLRILLQVGALPEASALLDQARDEMTRIESAFTRSASSCPPMDRLWTESMLVRQAPSQMLLNEGLLFLANAEHGLAADKFGAALEMQRGLHHEFYGDVSAPPPPPDCPRYDELSSPTLGLDAEASLMTPCLNNLALCSLRACRMHEAVEVMEGLVREDPTSFLTEGLAFNLCTLYELGSDNEMAKQKKKILQAVAKRFFLHDIGSESFRIT